MVELNTTALPTAPLSAAQLPEQLRYARWLDWGTRLGALVLSISFAAYVFGWLPPRIAVHDLPALWHLSAAEFARHTGTPRGWAWIGQLQHGDMAGLLGIAILATCSLPCLLALVPLYRRSGDKAYVAICLAEVAIVLLAASGVLNPGH